MCDLATSARRKAQGKTAAVISPIAFDAVRRIDALFDIEREINGKNADQRKTVRKVHSAPLAAELAAWMREQRAKLSRHNDVVQAIDYMLKRWAVFARFLDEGHICMSNNAAERALRGMATRESLCTPSSSIWKHWKRVGVSNATRATISGGRHFDRLRRQVIGTDLVRRSGNNLLGCKNAGSNKPAYRMVCDA